MSTVAFVQGQLLIQGQAIALPVPVAQLATLLGPSRHRQLKYTHVFTWDALGLMAYAKDGALAEGLMLQLSPGQFDFSPQTPFAQALTMDGHDVLHLRATNPSALVPLFKGDRGKAIVHGGFSVWFKVEDGVVTALEIAAHAPQPAAPAPVPAELDARFAHLAPVVKRWVAAIRERVPDDHPYSTWIPGVDAAQIARGIRLGDGHQVPDELVNFYQLVNVAYHPVTSAAQLVVGEHGHSYTLQAFKDLRQAWQDLQNLSDDLDPPPDATASTHILTQAYAHPGWIPLAHDTCPGPEGRYGQIIELDNESWARTVVADSLTDLLERNSDALERGQVAALDVMRGRSDGSEPA
ncbi:hypothetical protein CCO03_06945 [Comamonas serinivorans]|uniref:DUF7738 domain-containing protein n=1 Tax=Comamonas serinivorans TaxID=1082851 RepID=A0A1Y0EM99_9BURK|nr:SMI1/KNR4 family protein [Comamonas serinivorans]ARU04449.1 hypothetical protein CCO03_06945 [Comamonas serinivorans]